MVILKCKMCGGTLTITEDTAITTCEYCGSQQTFTKSKDEVITNLFNRANNMRLKCEFDKAQDVYEKILNEDDTDPESHWGIVLCKYGIEYVEDPTTFNRIPTCHRTHYESILTDADYLATLEHAEPLQREIYTAEANAISKLQKEILTIVQHEKPFDVFICYKETDEFGKRTLDSVMANDIYYQLVQEGFKVFYSAITLEDKLGQEYEPYIFAALNSARVMMVVGTKPEYFNAVWVKNEWNRYIQLMRNDRSRKLIPCYRDMDAYDLPDEFSHLQAQDMGKIGFINDIVRGIGKLCGKHYKEEDYKNAAIELSGRMAIKDSTKLENMLTKGFDEIELREYDQAYKTFKRAQEINASDTRLLLGLSALKGEPFYSRLKAIAPQISEPEKAILASIKNRFLFMQTFYTNKDRDRACYILKMGLNSSDFRMDHFSIDMCFQNDDTDFIKRILEEKGLLSKIISEKDPLITFSNDIKQTFKCNIKPNYLDLIHALGMSFLYKAKNIFAEIYARIIQNVNHETTEILFAISLIQCVDNKMYDFLIDYKNDMWKMIKNSDYIRMIILKARNDQRFFEDFHTLGLERLDSRILFELLDVAVSLDSKELIKRFKDLGAPNPINYSGSHFETRIQSVLEDWKSNLGFIQNHLISLDYLLNLYGTTYLHIACKALEQEYIETKKNLFVLDTSMLELIQQKGLSAVMKDTDGKRPYQYLERPLLSYLESYKKTLYKYLVGKYRRIQP